MWDFPIYGTSAVTHVIPLTEKKAKEVYLIGQGGFNQARLNLMFLLRTSVRILVDQVFAIIFEDGTDIIARINGSRALQDSDKPPAEIVRRIQSEFATIKFIQANTTIPVPEIVLENNFENDVGAPYSLQKRIIGQMIADIWPSKFNPSCMNGEQAISAVKQITDVECQLLRYPSFDSIGSLEYDEAANEFRVGPLTPLYKLSTFPEFHPGPWKSSTEYLRSLIVLQKSILQQPDWLDDRRSFFTLMNTYGNDIPKSRT
ncbi:hypothetical protein C8R41DRAFT_982984 [Lentinula lateritia]|uniref:Uncharacterized protein n=1 Tax=Lentinula lateritia TaxID=40482 RepID=A0ABQ8VBW6_9AGAR|nr:hypothetical protein C8R41DRAFT_982984 [Lentinula lateritia]